MGLRKLFRDNKSKAQTSVSDWLRPKFSAFGKKHKIAARIRLANAWATKHPKRTFGYVVSTLLAIFLFDIIISGYKLESQDPNFEKIAVVEPIFDGFRRIQSNKEAHQKKVIELTNTGADLRHELDSLMAIQPKSHEDSMAIITRYSRLEVIVKSLNSNDLPNHEK